MLLDHGALETRRIVFGQTLQSAQPTASVVEDMTKVDLARVDVGVEAMRVAGLVVDGVTPCAALADGALDQVKVPIQPVNPSTFDGQPAAAVDPGPPLAESRHGLRRMTVVELLSQQPEVRDPGWVLGAIVDAEIYVGVRAGLLASPRAAQGDRLHAFDPSEATGYHPRQLENFPCVFDHPQTPTKDPNDKEYTKLMDLFDESGSESLTRRAPLAERLRPKTLEEVVGQAHLTGEEGPLRAAVERGGIGSLILWGPPGTGKTTLARVLAGTVQEEFIPLSAVTSGVKDLRAALDGARERLKYEDRGTLVFVDEVHRFNKAQQDALLPALEEGLVDFIGATTENPSFEVTAPLLSRSRVLRLGPSPRSTWALCWRGGWRSWGSRSRRGRGSICCGSRVGMGGGC